MNKDQDLQPPSEEPKIDQVGPPSEVETPSMADIGLPPPPPSRFQAKSFLIWGVLIVIIIALFFTGYGLGGVSKRNQVRTLQNQVKELEKDKKNLGSQVSELEKTVADLDLGMINVPYQNSQYGYQFSYSSDLNLIDYSSTYERNNIIALEKDNKTIAVIKVGRRERPDDEHLGQAASGSSKVSGQDATKHEFPNGIVREGRRSDPFVAYKIVVESNQYVLEFYGSTTVSDTQKRIFNSFKFAEITQRSDNVFGF